jgi:antitoxin ParD1/3/4
MTDRPTLTFPLPEGMKYFVEQQVASGEYDSVAEYLCELIRADQKRLAKEELEHTLLSALKSSQADDLTPEAIEAIRQRLNR